MKNNRKKYISIGAILVIILLSALIYKTSSSTYERNLPKLEQSISTLKNNAEYELKDVTPFAWDVVYSFAPYTPVSEITKVIGFHSSAIKETVDEGMQQIIFVKDNNLVCYVYGYAENLRYNFNLGNQQEGFSKLENSAHPTFKIMEKENIKYIEYQGE